MTQGTFGWNFAQARPHNRSTVRLNPSRVAALERVMRAPPPEGQSWTHIESVGLRNQVFRACQALGTNSLREALTYALDAGLLMPISPRHAAILVGIASGLSIEHTAEMLAIHLGLARRYCAEARNVFEIADDIRLLEHLQRLRIPTATEPRRLLGTLPGNWGRPSAIPGPEVLEWTSALWGSATHPTVAATDYYRSAALLKAEQPVLLPSYGAPSTSALR